MVEVRGFEAGDIQALALQPQQEAEMAVLGDWRAAMEAALASGPRWSLLHDGRVMGVAGLGLHWQGRAELWGLIGCGLPRMCWPALVRATRLRLDQGARELGLRRIDASTAYGFPPGARLLEMLGFECEGLMRAYGPDGRDFLRYARIAP